MQDRIAARPCKPLGKRIAHQSVGARGFEGAAGRHQEGGVANMLDLVGAVGSHDSLSGNRGGRAEGRPGLHRSSTATERAADTSAQIAKNRLIAVQFTKKGIESVPRVKFKSLPVGRPLGNWPETG